MTSNFHRSLEIKIYVFGVLDRHMLMYKFHFDGIYSKMHYIDILQTMVSQTNKIMEPVDQKLMLIYEKFLFIYI